MGSVAALLCVYYGQLFAEESQHVLDLRGERDVIDLRQKKQFHPRLTSAFTVRFLTNINRVATCTAFS